MSRLIALTLVLPLLLATVQAEPQLGDDWKYDIVYRKQGKPLTGLVLEKSATHLYMRCIHRRPGSPTVTIRESLPLNEVDRVDLLGPEDRDILITRLKNLARERETLSAQLKLLDPASRHDSAGADQMTLTPAEWVQKDRGPGLEHSDTHFRLLSNSSEAVVQLVAIQLEQVYAAYQQNLPPRVTTGRPTTILLARDPGDYQKLVRARGGNFLNPAFYDVERNEIVCFSGLEWLHDEMEKSHKAHARMLAELEARRADLHELYKGKIPQELLVSFAEDQKRMRTQDELNALQFTRAKERLFQRLYHEAFHAYLATFVYPPSDGEVPRWLNEGLAQIFETAILEAGDLRVGHVNKERLQTIRLAAVRGTLVPLPELLRSTERAFLVAHAEDRPMSDRMYLTTWALAHYLTFDRKILRSPAFDDYIKALKREVDPLLAFRDLVNQPLEEFEKDFHSFLQRLRSDGTAGK